MVGSTSSARWIACARLFDLLVAIERDAEAPLGELPLDVALDGGGLGLAIALDGGVEAAERHQRLGGVAVEDRAAVVVEDARAALGIDELERAVVLGERVLVGADARQDEAELGGDALRLGAAGVEPARLLELGDGALAGARAAGLGMLRIGGRSARAPARCAAPDLARALADGLLAQRLRLVGDGEAALAVALLAGCVRKQLLGALEQPGARRRRRAHAARAGWRETSERRGRTCLSIRRRLTCAPRRAV